MTEKEAWVEAQADEPTAQLESPQPSWAAGRNSYIYYFGNYRTEREQCQAESGSAAQDPTQVQTRRSEMRLFYSAAPPAAAATPDPPPASFFSAISIRTSGWRLAV